MTVLNLTRSTAIFNILATYILDRSSLMFVSCMSCSTGLARAAVIEICPRAYAAGYNVLFSKLAFKFSYHKPFAEKRIHGKEQVALYLETSTISNNGAKFNISLAY